jgi:hypothetical protein
MTIVLISVARLDEMSLTPILARTAVIPAKKADATANSFQSGIGKTPSSFLFRGIR